jgi:hypothetical protein
MMSQAGSNWLGTPRQATALFGHQGSIWVSGYSPPCGDSLSWLLFTKTFTP